MTKLFKEFTTAQLSRLKKEYEPLRGQRISMNLIDKMNTMLSKYSTDMLVKLANTDIPFIATGAKNMAVTKRGKKWSDFKTKLDMAEADELQCEACWDSHKQVGTKISSKTGKRVPNCVPKEELQEALNKDDEKSVDDVVKQLKKAVTAHQGQVKSLTKDLKDEADLSKSQIKKAHDKADDLPKKDFIKRYGKDGDSVRYATATNMVKKKLGIEDVEEAFTKKDFKDNERDNEHDKNAKIVVGLFGTPQDVAVIDAINARHKKQRYISKEDQKKRDAIVNKYYNKLKEEVTKTGDDDLAPDALKLNAMVKDPHKSKGDNPKKDLNATYMKSDVRADVKNGGGTDMSKVNDKPKIQAALKKISASYESRKYHDTKPGSIQDAIMQMQMDEYKMITVEDKKLDGMIKTYLSKGGTITKLPPALQKGAKPSDMKKHKIGDKGVVKSHMYKMKEVREFITTYNSHFLTNYKAEEFILKDRLDEAMNISTVKKEIQKIYDTAKKDGYLGLKGHDDFKDLLQQTDTKKLYPKMHELGTFLSSATTGIFKTPSSAKSGALGKELVKLSYKIS